MPTEEVKTRHRVVIVAPDKHAILKDYAARQGKMLTAVVDEAISAYLVRKRLVQAEDAA